MAQMLTKRNSLHLLFVLLCASPVLGTYMKVEKYSADGCAAADLVEPGSYYSACFSGGAGTYYSVSCSSTAWSYTMHTDDECTDTGTEVATGTPDDCAADGSEWQKITCDQTPNYIMKMDSYSTDDCSGTAASSSVTYYDTECVDKTYDNGGTALSKKYVVSGGNMTVENYPSDDCSGTVGVSGQEDWTAFCGTCTPFSSMSVKVTCPAGSSVISGAPRVAPVPQLVGAPVLCMALLMKLLV